MMVPTQYLMVRVLFSLVAIATVMVGLLAFTPGFSVSPLGVLGILGLFFGVPYLFYIVGVKTALGSYLTGLALLGLVAWVQSYVSTNSYSSTAGVAYLWVFLYGWAIVFFALLMERLALTGASVRVALGLLILAFAALITSVFWFHVPVVLSFALIAVASVILVWATSRQRGRRRARQPNRQAME